jgi:hypothetical protein
MWLVRHAYETSRLFGSRMLGSANSRRSAPARKVAEMLEAVRPMKRTSARVISSAIPSPQHPIPMTMTGKTRSEALAKAVNTARTTITRGRWG